MIKYADFYRRFGVRKESQLKAFDFRDTKSFQLPRESVYHSLPTSSTDQSVDPQDLLVARHDGTTYCVHVEEYLAKEGTPTRLPINVTSVIRGIEKKNRALRRVRQMNVVQNNPKALLIYNYALLQHLYRYRVNFLNTYQRWWNTQATMWQTINQVAATSTRQQFVRIDIPQVMPSIADLNLASRNITRNVLAKFNTPTLLGLLDFWKWAGGEESAMGLLDPAVSDRVNLVFVDGNHVAVVNMAKLLEWRGLLPKADDRDEQEDEQFLRELEQRYKQKLTADSTAKDDPKNHKGSLSLFQRKCLWFVVRLVKLRSVNVAEVAAGVETDPAAGAEENNAVSSTTSMVEPVTLFDEDDTEDEALEPEPEPVEIPKLPESSDASAVSETPEVTPVATEPEPTTASSVPSDEELMNDELFELETPATLEVENDTGSATKDINVLEAPEIGVVSRAQELFERGVLSNAELKRFERLALKYQEIPNPYGEGTLKDLATIKEEHLKFDDSVITMDPIPGITDASMLKSTLRQFDSKYIKEVLHRDVANAVLSLQRVGVAVTDYSVDRVIDAVNKYDVVTVKVTPVAGSPSTMRFTVPVLEEDGSWMADGARYTMRKQRGDAPIHKVSPSRVALTSYDSKLFIERSTRVVHDYDTWLQSQIIAAQQTGDGRITSLKFRSGGDKIGGTGLPRLYTGLGRRFLNITTPDWEISFEYPKQVELYGQQVVAFLASQQLTPFARNGGSILAMDEAGAIYLLEGRKLSGFGDIGQLFGIDTRRAPLEVAEFKVAGGTVPVGIAVCYLLGLERVLADLQVEPRWVPKGTRLQLEPDEYAVRFFDTTMVLSKRHRKAALLMAGFQPFANAVANYPVAEFNRQDVYLNVIEGRGLGMRQLHGITDHKLFFIDPITLDLLKEMGEPTEFIGLLYRATEMLLNDDVPVVPDRYRGYERFAAAVYREVAKAGKAYRRRPVSAKASVDLNPNSVWLAIQTDPANGLIEDSNPINYLKEQEAVTFGGTGGRSARSMVRSTRAYKPEDFGVISEATKDSSDVGISTYFTANPKLKSLRGMTEPASFDDFEMTSAISTSALCAVGSLQDDR